MGWFSKTEKKIEEKIPALPDLPKLPELPEFSKLPEEDKEELHQLPSFPDSSFGTKLSQNAIKDAVSGKKEDDEVSETNDFDSEEERMMPEILKNPSTKEISGRRIPRVSREMDEEVPEEFEEAAKIVKRSKPVFIRLDRFEESMKIFENAREKITDIEHMLKDVEKIKEEENRELEEWKKEIKTIKTQIENIDQDVFSKIR